MAEVKAALGPFKEAIYPGAEENLRMDSLVRYTTDDNFDKVARFYRSQYDGMGKAVQLIQAEHEGLPTLCVAIGPACTDVNFAALMVMSDPAAVKRGAKTLWILVTPRE